MILLTGPTGGIGARVLSTVLQGPEPVGVVARTPGRLPADVRERVDVVEGVVRDTAPADLRAPMVARRDVAARLLLDDTWTGQDDVPVLGPQDVSPDDVARTLTEVLDRPVRYERDTSRTPSRYCSGTASRPAWPEGWSRWTPRRSTAWTWSTRPTARP